MSRSTRLILICHGETTASRNAAFYLDESLVEGESDKAAALLPPQRVRSAHVLSSPARCARETADAIALSYSVDPRLADLDHGLWAGRSLLDIQASEPEALQQWTRDWRMTPPDGESVADLLQRVAGWLADHIAHGGTIIAVTHRAICRAMIVSALDAPPEAFWKIDIGFLGKIVLTSDGRRWALRSLE